MTLKSIFIFLLSTTLFFSCNTELVEIPDNQQEQQEEEETNDDSILIKKIIYNMGTGDEYIDTFNYDGNKLINVDYGEGYKNVFTYDSNNNLVKDEFIGEGELIAFIELEYNSENKITSYTETFLEPSGLSDRKYKHTFTYNNNNTITDEVYISSSNADFELHRTETITLVEKNISEIANDNGYNRSYTYDDKNGTFKNIHAIEVLNILSENEFGAYIYGNSNNVITFIESDDSTSDNYNDNYAYTYNEANYPKTCIYTSQYGNEDDDVETIDYIYE